MGMTFKKEDRIALSEIPNYQLQSLSDEKPSDMWLFELLPEEDKETIWKTLEESDFNMEDGKSYTIYADHQQICGVTKRPI